MLAVLAGTETAIPVKRETKSRVITFRLSEEEYRLWSAACRRNRSSLSDIARKSILDWMESRLEGTQVHETLTEIRDRLDALYQLMSGKT
jgi:hypothetical protein